MPFDHKQQLSNFLNGMIAKGVPATKVEELRNLLTSDETITQYLSEGTLGQSEVNRKLDEARSLENTLKGRQAEWDTYLGQARQTLASSEQDRLTAERRAAAAETAIRALATQYNIPEEEARAIYNPSSFDAARGGSPTYQPQAPTHQPQSPVVTGLTKADLDRQLYGLVKDLAVKDSLASQHFALTGKPWDSTKALNYIEQQAALGHTVQIEDAWRITENIDSLQAAKLATDEAAKEAAMEQRIREKIAAENQGHLPSDPNPDFASAHISAIMQQAPPVEGQTTEPTGHHARTRLATEGLRRLQESRRLGTKSPYVEN